MRPLRFTVLGLAVALMSLAGAAVLPGRPASAADGGPASPPAGEVSPDASGTYTTLYRFTGGKNANWPRGGVALDAQGNVYGTLRYNGLDIYWGAIYKLTKPAKTGGAWAFKLLYKFNGNNQDGIAPTGPLVIKGNTIYGTTSAGANFSCGCGEVFKISTSGTGYTILHRFNNTQGSTPVGGVLVGPDGTLYGATSGGGPQGAGVVYKITAGGAFSVLHNFVGNSGSGPQGELVFGKDGAIYGSSFGNGTNNAGFIFRITTGGAYSVLFNFNGTPPVGQRYSIGADPEGRIAVGADGTLYGTTTFGGNATGYGTAWSLTPPKTTGGKWAWKQLYIFGEAPPLPNLPHSGLVIDSVGNLYGTGAGGGVQGAGVLYKLSRPKSGTRWVLTKLHDFLARDINGSTPYADIVLKPGVIYGSTLVGGHLDPSDSTCRDGCGVAFQHHL